MQIPNQVIDMLIQIVNSSSCPLSNHVKTMKCAYALVQKMEEKVALKSNTIMAIFAINFLSFSPFLLKRVHTNDCVHYHRQS